MRYAADRMEQLERELTAVTEQRDKAWQKIENQAERITYLEGATNHATGTPLSKAIEQRDRLAEVLRLITNGTSCRECGGEDQALLARESLQSLTPDQP
jgi:septal ring factor EnvC (AmiA/AmiB activator)